MLRIPIIDRLPIIGPLINDIVDGTKVVGAGPAPVPAVVETKVVAATGATAVSGFVLALLGPYLLKLPTPVRWIVKFIVPTLITAAAGYLAPHTERQPTPLPPQPVTS